MPSPVPRPADGFSTPDELRRYMYNACNPVIPAPEAYYYPLSEARGSNALSDDFLRRLTDTQEGNYLRFLFSGHNGGGKSSELLDLVRHLEDSKGLNNGKRYFPIYLDTFEYLNNDDADLPDLLLAIAAEIGEKLSKSSLQIELADNYFINLLKNVREGLLTELGLDKIEVGAALPGNLAALKAVIAPLKRSESARVQVRRALKTQTENLRTEINLVLEKARLELRSKTQVGQYPYDDIVLIVDNLEKIQRFSNENDIEKSLRELFIRNAPTLTGLNVHIAYTLPLRAIYAFSGEIQSAYGMQPFTMPMIAVEKRRASEAFYEKGRKCLRHLIEKRAGQSLETLFTEEALEWLLTMSGGHIRNLMIFLQSAFSLTKDLPINLDTAKRAVRPTLQLYSRAIPERYYAKMAKLYRDADRRFDTREDEEREMLEQGWILEYVNGDDEYDALGESWYAVNPVVRLLTGFRAAVNVIDDARKAAKQATIASATEG